MAFDGDQAGHTAAQRTGELDRNIQFRVARLPNGQDPADLLTAGDSRLLREAIAGAVPLEHHLIDQILARAHQRMASHYAAHVYADMAAVADVLDDPEGDPVWVAEAASAKIRAALTLTRRAADVKLGFAVDLKHRLPGVAGALEAGEIDVRRAKTIACGTVHLSAATAAAVVGFVVDQAPARGFCIEADPGEAQARYEYAVGERRAVTEPTDAGTANLFGLDLPPNRVAAATRRINRLARGLRGGGESRTMDQLRADVLLDLLGGENAHRGTPGKSGVVDIRVDLETLCRLADHPGELAGYGPVVADVARQAVEAQPGEEWRFVVTDGGEPVAVGVTRRRSTAAQRRRVEAHHPRCVFPGCRMPAVDCDLDHRVPWSEGGATTDHNLGPVCRHDHIVVRHRAGWTYRRLPNGDHQWTSPLDHTYTTRNDEPP